MYFLLLLIFNNLAPVLGATHMSEMNLHCLNDYEKLMVCHFTSDKSNCSEYNMDMKLLHSSLSVMTNCTFEDKERSKVISKCGCSIEMALIGGEQYRAQLWNSGELQSSKNINILESWKPKVPTILDVTQTVNGNFLVTCTTNYKSTSSISQLTLELNYRQKGETEEVSSTSHEILGKDLKPNTKYVLRVRTLSSLSSHISDWSEEWEFINPASPSPQIVILVLSITAVIITIALYWCYVRLKGKWWDNIPKCSNQDLLSMVPGEIKVLSHRKIVLSSIYVDSPKMDITDGKPWTTPSIGDESGERCQNGSGTDSSSLGYAHTCPTNQEHSNEQIIKHVQEALSKVFPNLVHLDGHLHKSSLSDSSMMDYASTNINCPQSNRDSAVCSSDYDAEVGGSESYSYNNRSYLSCKESTLTSLFSTQPLPFCDSAYHPDEGEVLKNVKPQVCLATVQQDLNLSTNVAPLMQKDFSCCPYDGGSKSTPSTEGTSLSYASSENNVFTADNVKSDVAGYQSFSEAVSLENKRGTDIYRDAPLMSFQHEYSKEAPNYGMNQCCNSLPTPECDLPPSDGDYQDLQNLRLNSPDLWIPGPGQSAEQVELLKKYQESEIPQSPTGNMSLDFIHNSQGEPCLTLGNPFLSTLCTNQILNDSTYHCL